MAKIKCVVEECVYNDHEACNASVITVSSTGNKEVDTCEGTACKTFRRD